MHKVYKICILYKFSGLLGREKAVPMHCFFCLIIAFRQLSRRRNRKPPAMRVGNKSYTKMPLSGTIRVFRSIVPERSRCMANQTNSLAHTKWMCKYHIVFIPKYRRKAIYKQYRALMMFDRHANLKYKYGNRHFWAEGYYVSTVGLNESTIRKYIADQEKHDIALDKLSVKEYEDPFKGSK